MAALGYRPYGANGELSLAYVVVLSLADTALLLSLIAVFLSVHGEGARDLFLGNRPIGAEARAGLPLALIALGIGVIVLVVIQQVAPWLHTVPSNPLQSLVRTPHDAALFAVVAVVAGGVREEVQRAFLLRRFERWLGGSQCRRRRDERLVRTRAQSSRAWTRPSRRACSAGSGRSSTCAGDLSWRPW